MIKEDETMQEVFDILNHCDDMEALSVIYGIMKAKQVVSLTVTDSGLTVQKEPVISPDCKTSITIDNDGTRH